MTLCITVERELVALAVASVELSPIYAVYSSKLESNIVALLLEHNYNEGQCI